MTQVVFTHQQDQDLNDLLPIKLPCPKSGNWITYLYNDDNQLFEIQQVAAGRKTCWMIDSVMHKNGTFRLMTPMDPLFIALPLLEQAREDDNNNGTFRRLEDIFSSENILKDTDEDTFTIEKSTGLHQLSDIVGIKQGIAHLCDTQDVGQGAFFVYRFNDKKALEWLRKKVDAIVENFSRIPTLVDSVQDEMESKEENIAVFQRESINILTRYLKQSWRQKLLDSYNLADTSKIIDQNAQQSIRISPSDFFKPASIKAEPVPVAKKTKLSESQRKAVKNTRPLTSFFKKSES
ncbi:ribonuclease H2, subunit B [Phycomyces nitens]|nr:ribonuclease H2, subunit B [Phycomyces nitens]